MTPQYNEVVSRSRGHAASQYILLGSENFVETALPEFIETRVVVLATPRGTPAQFGQYLLRFAPGGGTSSRIRRGFENFFYVLDGDINLTIDGGTAHLSPGGFAYTPSTSDFAIVARQPSSILWTKRPYDAQAGL